MEPHACFVGEEVEAREGKPMTKGGLVPLPPLPAGNPSTCFLRGPACAPPLLTSTAWLPQAFRVTETDPGAKEPARVAEICPMRTGHCLFGGQSFRVISSLAEGSHLIQAALQSRVGPRL